MGKDRYRTPAQQRLERADIHIDGDRPWDLQVHDPRLFRHVLRRGSLGLGEAYMDGWWDAERLDEFFFRILRARLERSVGTTQRVLMALRTQFFNLQSRHRAFEVGERHYDLGNDLFQAMLDARMVYTCAYWPRAENLDQAQEHKLDLVCRKLDLKAGDEVLDIGCGWGAFGRFAAERYGARVTGITVSRRQAEFGNRLLEGLPGEIRIQDYREVEGRYDHVVSLGMFEHVGHKNYKVFMDKVAACLKPEGLFLLHTIGRWVKRTVPDPWISRYIFPNGQLPAFRQIADASLKHFVLEDFHSFGQDYDHTLMAWHANFQAGWPELKDRYGERFRRMWQYYLLQSAGAFRARRLQLWQLVFSPGGRLGGYRAVV